MTASTGAGPFDRSVDEPAAPGDVFLGLGVFLLAILSSLANLLPVSGGWTDPLRATLFVYPYVVVFIGLVAGWGLHFPRWSFPYLAYAVVCLAALSTGDRTPLGLPWWTPALVLVAILLLATRSARPLLSLGREVWRDWTQLSFAFYTLETTFASIALDETGRLYEFSGQMLMLLVLTAGALGYLRARTMERRFLYLVAGITAIWLIETVGSTFYWSRCWTAGQSPWQALLALLPVLAVMLAPILAPAGLGVLRNQARAVRSRGNAARPA